MHATINRQMVGGEWVYADPLDATLRQRARDWGFDLAGFDDWLTSTPMDSTNLARFLNWRAQGVACVQAGNIEGARAWTHALWALSKYQQSLEIGAIVAGLFLDEQKVDGRRRLPDSDDEILEEIARLTRMHGSERAARGTYAAQQGVTLQGLGKRLRKIRAEKLKPPRE